MTILRSVHSAGARLHSLIIWNDGPGATLLMMLQEQHQHSRIRSRMWRQHNAGGVPCRMQIFAASVLWPVHGIIQTWWSMTGNYVEDDQWEGKGFVLTAAPCSCLQTAWRRAGQRGKSNPNLIITWRWCPSWVINRLTMCYSVPELQGQVSKVSHLCCLLNMAFTYSLCLL